MNDYQPDKYAYNWIWDRKVLEKEFYDMRDRIAKAKTILKAELECYRSTNWTITDVPIEEALAALEANDSRS